MTIMSYETNVMSYEIVGVCNTLKIIVRGFFSSFFSQFHYFTLVKNYEKEAVVTGCIGLPSVTDSEA